MPDGKKVVVRDAWPTMKADERADSGFEGAEDGVPLVICQGLGHSFWEPLAWN